MEPKTEEKSIKNEFKKKMRFKSDTAVGVRTSLARSWGCGGVGGVKKEVHMYIL